MLILYLRLLGPKGCCVSVLVSVSCGSSLTSTKYIPGVSYLNTDQDITDSASRSHHVTYLHRHSHYLDIEWLFLFAESAIHQQSIDIP
jgi:hypothetical protein